MEAPLTVVNVVALVAAGSKPRRNPRFVAEIPLKPAECGITRRRWTVNWAHGRAIKAQRDILEIGKYKRFVLPKRSPDISSRVVLNVMRIAGETFMRENLVCGVQVVVLEVVK